MINNPDCGWCDFIIGEFEGTPSYLTNVPVELLRGFIDYYTSGISSIFFDEEGNEFILVLSPLEIYIIEEKEQPILHTFSYLNPTDLAKELINDIESDFEKWCSWIYCENVKQQRELLLKLTNELKLLVSNRS